VTKGPGTHNMVGKITLGEEVQEYLLGERKQKGGS
jgi:hypothetical protein